MINALLIDDEKNNLANLQFMLEHDCNGVNVVATFQSAESARNWLKNHKVDVVFLDIHMPNENGFQFLQSLPSKDFIIVFVTAFNEYALNAIKSNALDYILKPINIIELKSTIEKIKIAVSKTPIIGKNEEVISQFLASLNKSKSQKIALPQLGGVVFIELDEIVSLQADSNYTIIHMKEMQKKVITKTLKDFEEILDVNFFVRIHKSYIVNLKYVKEYSTIDGGVVKMVDGNQWSISRRQLDTFLEKMKDCSLMFKK